MARADTSKVMYRIENYIERFKNTEVWVLASNKRVGELYWKQIQRNINTNNIKPFIVTSRLGTLDGIKTNEGLILVCGKWWENPNASIIMNRYFNMASKVIPIDEIR